MNFTTNEVLIRPNLTDLEEMYKRIISKRLNGEINFNIEVQIENDEDMSMPGVSCKIDSKDDDILSKLYDELGELDAPIEMGYGMLHEIFPFSSFKHFFDESDELCVSLSFEDYEKMTNKEKEETKLEVLRKPLTFEEIKKKKDGNDVVDGIISLRLDNVITDYERFLDILEEKLVGGSLFDIGYSIVGFEDNETLLLRVSGNVSPILEDEEDFE